MIDIQTLKARVDLRTLVQETHPVTNGSKTHCLWHDDKNPSLHIYPDGYFCFACGASGDHFDWLMATRASSFQEAVEALTHSAGASTYSAPVPGLRPSSTPSKASEPIEKPTFEWNVPLKPQQLETHKRRAARLTKVPEALKGRGFTLTDCKRLDIVNENGNAVFPVIDPSGLALTLKCRYAVPDPHRYEYVTPGRGTPAWCSPGICQAKTILIIEGELNGMICWLACQEQIGVMGTAGTNGLLHLEVLKDKTVYIYADDDEAGHEAKLRWGKQTLGASAKEVFLLEPWSVDACDIAGAFGKAGLRKRLTWSKKHCFASPEAIGAVDPPSATPPTLKPFPVSSTKPDLMQWCSHSEGTRSFSPQRYLQNHPPALTLESCHDAA